ncbi:MAG: hypothetical protein R3F11_17660 [Verrucomicrobiales bacterium]
MPRADGVTFDEGEIFFRACPVVLQRVLRLLVAGKDEDARGVAVEPVDDERRSRTSLLLAT